MDADELNSDDSSDQDEHSNDNNDEQSGKRCKTDRNKQCAPSNQHHKIV